MNQIIQTPSNSMHHYPAQPYILDKSRKKKKSVVFLKFYYLFSSIIVLFFSFYYFYRSFNVAQNERLSQVLMGNYDISRLYSDISSSPDTASVNIEKDGDTFSVIGILQIDKIDLKYPILSDISDHLLKIAPCRFHGPLPR